MRPYAWLWFDAAPATVVFLMLSPEPIPLGAFVAFLLAAICADAGSCVLNDVYDVETDRLSPDPRVRARPVVTGAVSARAGLAQASALFALGLLLAAVAAPAAVFPFAVAIVLGAAYSAPPLRLNSRPWASQPFWGILCLAGYAAVAVLARRWITLEVVVYAAGVVSFMGTGAYFAKDLRDLANDRAAGKNTRVVELGPRAAAARSLLGCALGSAIFAFLLWWHGEVALWARVAGSAVLAVWLARSSALVSRLRIAYSNDVARKLDAGYLRTYLLYNVAVILGLADGLARALQ
jgi:4-hydroxybenzoate polyprenyltransferase